MTPLSNAAPVGETPPSCTSGPARFESIWIVVPAYHEATRLAGVLQSLCQPGRSVVVVDDGSRDATAAVAAERPVWVVRHPINCGQGRPSRRGSISRSSRGADVIVTFDADGQHDSQEIDRLIAPLLAGETDVVLGSRFLGQTIGMPLARRLMLRAAVLFTRLTARIRVTDAHNGFRAFSRDAAERIRIDQPRMAHASEILSEIGRLGLRYREVPVTVRYTDDSLRKGQSTWDALRITGQLLLGRIAR
ncbi:MAG: glycosyltransferase family 2 protein [Planctomycetaceae bacterium]